MPQASRLPECGLVSDIDARKQGVVRGSDESDGTPCEFEERGPHQAQRGSACEEVARVRAGVRPRQPRGMGGATPIFLFLGRQNQAPLFLHAKEAQAVVLERFVGRSE